MSIFLNPLYQMDFCAVRYAATNNNLQCNNQVHVHGTVAKVTHIWRSIPLQQFFSSVYSFSLISAVLYFKLLYPPAFHLCLMLLPSPIKQLLPPICRTTWSRNLSPSPQNKDHSSQTCSLLYPEDRDSTFLCDSPHVLDGRINTVQVARFLETSPF